MKRLLYYSHLFWLYLLQSFKEQLAYRASFFIAVFGKVLRIGVYFLLFESLFLFTDNLGGFNHDTILVHFFTMLLMFTITTTSFQRNLTYALSGLVRKGDLDGMLVKPIHPLFHVAFFRGDIFDAMTMIPVAGLLVYTITRLPDLSLTKLMVYVLSLGFAVIFVFGLSALLSSVAFKTINSFGAGRVLHAILRGAQYPATAFGGGWGTFLMYVFPIGFIATVPVGILTGILEPWHFLYQAAFSLIVLFMSAKIWTRALRGYSSASS